MKKIASSWKITNSEKMDGENEKTNMKESLFTIMTSVCPGPSVSAERERAKVREEEARPKENRKLRSSISISTGRGSKGGSKGRRANGK